MVPGPMAARLKFGNESIVHGVTCLAIVKQTKWHLLVSPFAIAIPLCGSEFMEKESGLHSDIHIAQGA